MTNTTHLPEGVHKIKDKYISCVKVGGCMLWQGPFKTLEEAEASCKILKKATFDTTPDIPPDTSSDTSSDVTPDTTLNPQDDGWA